MSSRLLTAITGPGLGGGQRTFLRLHYHRRGISRDIENAFHGVRPVLPLFPPASAANVRNPILLDAIFFPGTATGYWFRDP